MYFLIRIKTIIRIIVKKRAGIEPALFCYISFTDAGIYLSPSFLAILPVSVLGSLSSLIAACAADVLYCHSVICIHQGKQMVNMNQL